MYIGRELSLVVDRLKARGQNSCLFPSEVAGLPVRGLLFIESRTLLVESSLSTSHGRSLFSAAGWSGIARTSTTGGAWRRALRTWTRSRTASGTASGLRATTTKSRPCGPSSPRHVAYIPAPRPGARRGPWRMSGLTSTSGTGAARGATLRPAAGWIRTPRSGRQAGLAPVRPARRNEVHSRAEGCRPAAARPGSPMRPRSEHRSGGRRTA